MAARGVFGHAAYSGSYRRIDASTFFGSHPEVAQQTPTPPAAVFVLPGELRPKKPLESSAVFTAQAPGTFDILGIRRWMPMEPGARQLYHTTISQIRGNAGPAAPPIPEPPRTAFLDTPPATRTTLRDGGGFFAPIFKEFQITGGGAWIATVVPFNSGIQQKQDSPVFHPPVFVPLVPMEIRTFIPQSLSYTKPWVRDNSQYQMPIVASVFFPYEVRTFHNPTPPWFAYGSHYRRESTASTVGGMLTGIFSVPTSLLPPALPSTEYYDIYHYYTGH